MGNLGIDDDQIIRNDIKGNAAGQEFPLAAENVEQLGERVAVNDAVPVAFIFGGGHIQQPGAHRLVLTVVYGRGINEFQFRAGTGSGKCRSGRIEVAEVKMTVAHGT